MNALRRQNIRPQQTFERWTPRTQESPHELARQNEAKSKQAPQSETNVCQRRRTCNFEKASLINCTGNPIMHRPPTQIRGSVLLPWTQSIIFWPDPFGQDGWMYRLRSCFYLWQTSFSSRSKKCRKRTLQKSSHLDLALNQYIEMFQASELHWVLQKDTQ